MGKKKSKSDDSSWIDELYIEPLHSGVEMGMVWAMPWDGPTPPPKDSPTVEAKITVGEVDQPRLEVDQPRLEVDQPSLVHQRSQVIEETKGPNQKKRVCFPFIIAGLVLVLFGVFCAIFLATTSMKKPKPRPFVEEAGQLQSFYLYEIKRVAGKDSCKKRAIFNKDGTTATIVFDEAGGPTAKITFAGKTELTQQKRNELVEAAVLSECGSGALQAARPLIEDNICRNNGKQVSLEMKATKLANLPAKCKLESLEMSVASCGLVRILPSQLKVRFETPYPSTPELQEKLVNTILQDFCGQYVNLAL